MLRRLALCGAVLTMFVLSTGVANAEPGKGNACPPASPGHGRTPPPGCGHPNEDPPPPPPPPAADPCTAAAGDPGLLTENTLGQELWDAGLQIPPLTEDPDADGPLSGAIYDGGNGTGLEPVTDEVACVVDFLIDQSVGFDL